MDPGRLILIQSINLFFLTTNFPINEESWAKEPAIPLHRIPLDSVSVVIDSVYAFAMTCSYGQSIYSQGCRIDPQDPHMCPAGSGPLLHRLLYAHHTLVFRAPAFPGTTVPQPSALRLNIASLAFICLIPFSTNFLVKSKMAFFKKY